MAESQQQSDEEESNLESNLESSTKEAEDHEKDNQNPADDSDPEEIVAKKDKGGKTIKKHKAGIIYLSRIPPGMKIQQIREYFSTYGDVLRTFLQPETEKSSSKKSNKWNKRNPTYTEGWIEFKKRKQAKSVAAQLNNVPVGGKKSKVYHDFLWNIKYLTGFQWVHLNERLAYERISRQQKLRAEISAAKRETNFFAKSIGLKKKFSKKRNVAGPSSSSKDDMEVE